MFRQLIESTAASQKRRSLALAAALTIHLILVCALLLIPMVAPQILSAQLPKMILLVSPPPPLGTPHATTPAKGKAGPDLIGEPTVLQTPSTIPDSVSPPHLAGVGLLLKNEPIDPLIGFPFGFPGGSSAGLIGSSQGSVASAIPVPVPPRVPLAAHPVRIGGEVQQANLIVQIKPQYPILAKQAGIQGAVVLEAVISRGGTIVNLKVISGHPFLIQGALEAVRQWRYKPTLLNNEPVEVLTTITVNFGLGRI
jgi:protein TonB